MTKRQLYIISLLLLFVPCRAQEKKQSVFEVTRIPVNETIFSEISPVTYSDGIIFCSDRRFSSIKDRKSFEGRRLYNLYYAERKDSAEWKKPEEIISERTNLFNNGPLCFSPDGKTVYFTSDLETGKITRKRSFRNHSGIFTATLEGKELKLIQPFVYNKQDYDIGQPSVSNNGKYLFFASNMPGGTGGSDLYYCEWVNGQWSTPVNLGPEVNSQGTESFPFYHSSGRLYFSSDRPGGNGKLDVYYTTLNLGKWGKPVLLADPINSPYDDFAFFAGPGIQNGFFSSNRKNSDDIYQFRSLIIRKTECDTLAENNYCFELFEENAIKFDTIPFRYEWKFGDGSPTATGTSVVHCYPGAGSYLVQLDVVNLITKEVMYNEKTYRLEIEDIEQPYISGPDKAYSGEKLVFNADSTNLPGWNIRQYYWNFDDESIAIGKDVDKIYSTPGTYNIQLIVTADPEPGNDVVREACVCKNIVILRQP
jgi:hypothetical protein